MVRSCSASPAFSWSAPRSHSSTTRTPVPDRVASVSGRIAAVCVAAAALAGVIVAIGVIGNPVSWAGDRWDDFKGGYSEQGFGDSRFSGDLGSNRYDFWRVVINDQFADGAACGRGFRQLSETYLVNRKSEEDPLYPHSLPLRILGSTGLVGLLLFAGFTVAMVLALVRSRTGSGSAFRGGLVGAAVGAVAYVTLHSAGDWLWSFPAIIAPAFAWLGMVSRSEPAPDRAIALRSARAGTRIVLAAASVAIGLFAVASLTLPWLAARDVQIASESWGADPNAAFERLDRARGLNFLSAEPNLTAGAIASSMNDEGRIPGRLRAGAGARSDELVPAHGGSAPSTGCAATGRPRSSSWTLPWPRIRVSH